MPIIYDENTPLGTVQKAMAEAYMERSSPDGGMDQCYTEAHVHLLGMTVGVVLEWEELLKDEVVSVFFDADNYMFYITGNDNEYEEETDEYGEMHW